MSGVITIADRCIGADAPVFIIAEMSANHGQDLGQAKRIIEAMADAGADAVKVQTYTPDTITLDCDNDFFRIKGTLWEGRTLYGLYGEAYTPWEWHGELKEFAESCGLIFFSTPFDDTAVEFLEELNVPCHKIASFEIVDIPLIRKVAGTGKPVIMSTGMASEKEIFEAVAAFREAGGSELALLKCTSAYPAPPGEMNLRCIPYLAERFGVASGLSDHTLGADVTIAAVAVGASIVEKHFCLDRGLGGPDSAFSLEPHEFKAMVNSVRTVEKALGQVDFSLTDKQIESRVFRRSLFVVEDVKAGESFSSMNVRSIRPGDGLHTRHYNEVLGLKARHDISRGTPLSWDVVEKG